MVFRSDIVFPPDATVSGWGRRVEKEFEQSEDKKQEARTGVSACGRHGLKGSRFGAYLTTSLYF
jgi:hypothetical protein